MMLGAILRRLGYLFYIVDPTDSYKTLEDVPKYSDEALPLFIVLMALEIVVIVVKKGKKAFRISDALCSISQGVFSELIRLWTRAALLIGYVYVHSKWRLITLPWDSTISWVIGLLAVDFAYYWLHRSSHEVNILWAAHKSHHSSEDFNLTTALRQPVLQNVSYMLFYFPLALVIPPTVFLVHSQLNLVYQFWIHTEVVNKLGPLEYVLNTPSHHRVHHGRNRKYIDVNYAGVLIVWDRIFGTFRPETEEVVYGLTQPSHSFNPLEIQLGHYVHICRTVMKTPGLKNKFSVVFKGPGWSPGKPRLGDKNDLPDVHAPIQKFDPEIPLWIQFYVAVHFLLVLLAYTELSITYGNKAFQLNVLCGVLVLLASLTSLGAILDQKPYAPVIEIFRCLFFVWAEGLVRFLTVKILFQIVPSSIILLLARAAFTLSAVIWAGFLYFRESHRIKKLQ